MGVPPAPGEPQGRPPAPAEPQGRPASPGAFRIEGSDGHARAGTMTLVRGEVATPCFMPVGTMATVKSLSPTTAVPFPETARAMLALPFGVVPSPSIPESKVQRKASPS